MSKINLGDVVAPLNHPFYPAYLDTIISGEHLMIPPMMIITEILATTRGEYSELDGSKTALKDTSNCKCLWFSSKTNQFEETWISSNQLKVLSAIVAKTDNPKSLVGKLVSLKSLRLETGKRKSNLTNEQKEGASLGKTSISSLLSFVPPIMQVVEVKEADDKEKKFDVKSGLQKRFISSHNVKCKWFNANSEKFSERYIPLEALLFIPVISNEKLDVLKKFIDAGSILKLGNSLVKPLSLSFNSGEYEAVSK